MASVEFIYEHTSTIIQCNREDKMNEIFRKFEIKSKIDLKSVYFIYGGNIVNKELTYSQIVKFDTKVDNIVVLVYKIECQNEIVTESITKPKFIMCPICNENIRYYLNDYKINLYDCRNGHQVNNILLCDFENIQKYDMSKIICQECNIKNKKEIAYNEFYKCLQCNYYLCPLCKTNHNKRHHIINIDKNYTCSIHNEIYSKYCLDCNINLCFQCSNKHKKHNCIYFDEIMPKFDEINSQMKELRNYIDIFKQNINDITKKLNEVIDGFEVYYRINKELINNYNNMNRNYEILNNINEINYSSDIIIDTLIDINKENDIMNKLQLILGISSLWIFFSLRISY